MSIHPKQLNLSHNMHFTGGNILLESGKIMVGNGTESSPSIGFSSNPSTGMFMSSTGEFAISAGAQAVIYLKDDGTVEMTGTTGLAMQAGTSADRPAQPLEGILRYNLDTSRHETFVDNVWYDIATTADVAPMLKVDGTRAMTGALNMGNQNITNAGTVNGVTVQSHAARHAPGGSDALATASAVGLTLSSTNTEGTSSAFARADHTHTITGVQPLNPNLTALGAPTLNGFYVRTSATTAITQSITGTVNTISVINGSGVAGPPIISIVNNPVIPGNASITVPAGTTAQRPGTNNVGMIRYNSDLTRMEMFRSNAWYSLADTIDLNSYLRLDGTSTMTGALNMGSQNITNAGTLNGVSITAHAARHNPGGADALATASAVGLTLSTANAEGSAAAFARADHTHAITGVQASSAQLTALAALSTTGQVTRTGANTFVTRTETGTANQITVTNGDGVAGNPTFAIATNPTIPGNITSGTYNGVTVETHAGRHAPSGADPLPTAAAVGLSLATTNTAGTANAFARADHTHVITGVQAESAQLTSLAAIATTGHVVRTGTNTFATRSLTGTAGRTTVVNGDGIAGNPTVDLVGGIVPPGSYSRVVVDTYGRVTSGNLSFATYYATRFDSPMTTGSWPIKAQAAAYLDPAHPSMTVRGFDDTTPEGVGISADVPPNAVSCNITLVGRARTGPSAAQAALWNVYFHSYPISVLAPDWGSAIALNPINVAQGNIFLYAVTTNVTLVQMGLTAGSPYQMEIVRNANAAGDTLVGDFCLFYAKLDWQAV